MPPGNDRLKKALTVICIALPTLLLDILTKNWIIRHLSLHEHIDVLPFFRIVHVENRGAAFGMFSGLGNFPFIILAIIAIIVIGLYIARLPRGIELYSLSLIIGGAAGNLLDRFRYGKVIDFLDLFWNDWHWPAFNVADSALTVGIAIFVITGIFGKKTSR